MLHIHLTKSQLSIGLRLTNAFFDCCNQISIAPFEKILAECGTAFFDPNELDEFVDDLQLSFFQRLVRLEQTEHPDYTALNVATGCSHMPPERVVFLFQYFDHQKQWIPEIDMAFHLHFAGEHLLTGISRCDNWIGHHKVTLTQIITAPDGTDYYPGETVPVGWLDAWQRQVLRQKLTEDRERFRRSL